MYGNISGKRLTVNVSKLLHLLGESVVIQTFFALNIFRRDHALFGTNEQGTSPKIEEEAGSRQMAILEQGAQNDKKEHGEK